MTPDYPSSFTSDPSPQGCYTVILNAFETYVYLAGALAIGVLAIEVSEDLTSAAPQKQDTNGTWGRSPMACNPQPISISTSLTQDPWGPHYGDCG